MDNKSMVQYKESFFSKIGKFFKNLFGKKEEKIEEIKEIQSEDIEQTKEVVNENEQKSKFFNDIKVETKEIDKASKRRAFLDKVEGNEEELSKLNMPELLKLEKYYDKIIEQNNQTIKRKESTV